MLLSQPLQPSMLVCFIAYVLERVSRVCCAYAFVYALQRMSQVLMCNCSMTRTCSTPLTPTPSGTSIMQLATQGLSLSWMRMTPCCLMKLSPGMLTWKVWQPTVAFTWAIICLCISSRQSRIPKDDASVFHGRRKKCIM